MMSVTEIPLGLYIHIPWCVRKCPYCDFNSHLVKNEIPQTAYVARLLDDLSQEAQQVGHRQVQSIFIGGGTPSLMDPTSIEHLLIGIKNRVDLHPQAEITIEANPGTVDNARLAGFVQAGINRFSLGVQSFFAKHLQKLGRIHNRQQAIDAANIANTLPLTSFNLDLMHGLPAQTPAQALTDLQQAIILNAPHLSWYQLTIEPNTPFASQPPPLPDDEVLSDIEQQGLALLNQAGYQRYEVSAFAKPGHQSKHNSLYWRFGDYIGIGCGAHGKITHGDTGHIQRRVKVKHPRGYLDLTRTCIDQQWLVDPLDLPLEYFMNRLRLFEPIPKDEFRTHTGLDAKVMQAPFSRALDLGLLHETATHWQLTKTGARFLNQILKPLISQS